MLLDSGELVNGGNVRSAAGEGKQRLIAALFDEFGDGGPNLNLSVRYIAERLGVHHTLLTYHFGSRPGLLTAVMAEARRRDNAVIAAASAELNFTDACRFVWRHFSDVKHRDRVKAFFHVVGLAIYDSSAFADLVSDLDDLTRLLETVALRDGYSAATARWQSVMAVACLRGLLLQQLINSNEDIIPATEHFFSTLERSARNSQPG